MEVLEAIEKRASCRKYKEKDVDREMLAVVLNAGRLAPSAGNLQDRVFVVVRGKEKRLQIAEACAGQMWMQFAPVHIIVVADNRKMKQHYGIRGERVYALQECATAAENMLLAATDLGLGACFVSAFDEDKIKKIININTQAARPQIVITLGWPAEELKQAPKNHIEKVVWVENYENKIEEVALSLDIWSDIIAKRAKMVVEKAKLPQKQSFISEKLKEHGRKLKERMFKKK